MHKGSLPIVPIVVTFFAIAAFLGVMYYALPASTPARNTNTVTTNTNAEYCTADAKLCPDGSAVGRTGPNCEFAECPATNSNTPTNAGVNTNSSVNTNTTSHVGQVLTPVHHLKVSSQVYLWSGSTISTVPLASGTASASFTFPATGTVMAVAYNDQIQGIGYITTSGQTDVLKYRNKGNDTFWTLDSLTRTGTDEVRQANKYSGVQFLGTTYLMGTVGYWEGCDSRVFSVEKKTKVYTAGWCGTTSVSPDGKRIVRASVAGMGTGNEFSIANSFGGDFTPIDWSKIKGAPTSFAPQPNGDSETGFEVVGFLNNDEAVIRVAPLTDNSQQLATLNFATSTYQALPALPDDVVRATHLINHTLLSLINDTLYVYNLDTKKLAMWKLGSELGGGRDNGNRIAAVTRDAVILSVQYDYRNNVYATKELVAVDTTTGEFINLPTAGLAGVVTP